ncbi:MAG: hypothetical protein FWE21_02635 [Defluviitaleaceae bacterium]|nr:hypothetical protein [Defluviitaleaceae bacterium]
MDAYLQKMAQDISNRQYNAGLKKAQVGDLSGAVAMLQLSLQTNKKNTYARNLLGLCHYATGRIGFAMGEWETSCRHQPEGNLAKTYLENVRGDFQNLEKYGEATKGYNEALAFFSDGDEDLAVIRLKRAVEILPRFVDAMNLLALYYLKEQDKTKAAAMAERVLEVDKGNETAKQYYFAIFQKHYGEKPARSQKLESRSQMKAEKPEAAPAKRNPLAVRNQKVFTKASPVSGIVSAIIGMVAMFLFMQTLILPGMLAERDDEIAALHTQITQQQHDHEQTAATHADILLETQTQISGLDREILDYQDEVERLQNQVAVGNALHLLRGGQPATALAQLENVDNTQLDEVTLAFYEEIRQTAPPLAEQAYHSQAVAFFNAGNRVDARVAWENAAGHSLPGSNIGGDILYWLGRIAELDGNPALALQYYETALDSFPTFSRRWNAQSRRNALS